jgi:hypothetical protein
MMETPKIFQSEFGIIGWIAVAIIGSIILNLLSKKKQE